MYRRRKTSRLVAKGVAMSVVLSAMFLAGCDWNRAEDGEAGKEFEKISLAVRASEAGERDISKTLSFSGSIDAFRRVSVAPASPGQIERIFVEEGQNVRQGQMLVKMDDRQLQAAAANLRQLRNDYERIKTLRERGSTTQQAYDQIRSGYEAAKASHDLLKSSVEIRAPYAGTIIGKHFNDGEIYTGAPGAAGSAGIVELAQLGRMKIEIMVPEQDLVRLKPDQQAYVRTSAYPDTVFQGRVHTVNPALNRMSRTSRVTIEIDNPDRLLMPGMFARVEIVTDVFENVLSVPVSSIVRRNGEALVFVVDDMGETPFDTKPEKIAVETGIVTERYAEITGGLDSGAFVLTENNVSLTETTDIRVVSVERIIKE
ncbi:Cobalt/zinc/cadmium efflux RND transporter, membrane fusion protein, CzcB family [Chitinispirillum alkaliphilum]|nr:Cobalt/zinc/cadmium efflux RND transporter, membrane fusion protein, CzcB family [Chitinispirillum alkaliphilum]